MDDVMLEDLREVFRMARLHEESSFVPGVQVGDLEAFAKACWATMRPEDRLAALQTFYAAPPPAR